MNFLELMKNCNVFVNLEYLSTISSRIESNVIHKSIRTRCSESHSDLFGSSLYDQIQLIKSSICQKKFYLHAWQISGNVFADKISFLKLDLDLKRTFRFNSAASDKSWISFWFFDDWMSFTLNSRIYKISSKIKIFKLCFCEILKTK